MYQLFSQYLCADAEPYDIIAPIQKINKQRMDLDIIHESRHKIDFFLI